MRYLSRAQMAKADRITITRYGIPALLLMENAGRIVAEESVKLMGKNRRAKALVICGKGNNGGDGLVAARYLYNRHIHTNILYLDKLINPHRTAETAVNLNIVQKLNIPLLTELPPAHQLHTRLPARGGSASRRRHSLWRRTTGGKKIRAEIRSETDLLAHLFHDYDLLIDAIFGVGLEREVLSPYREVIDAINNSMRPALAVDIPSGLDADTGRPLGAAVRAKVTVTMAAPKKGFLKPSARPYTGKIIVADIGIPDEVITSLTG